MPLEFEQIEITSDSFGDDLVVSVVFTTTSNRANDQFVVVHKEPAVFDNSSLMLEAMLDAQLPSIDGSFGWLFEDDTKLSEYEGIFQHGSEMTTNRPYEIENDPFESIPLSITLKADGDITFNGGATVNGGDIEFTLDDLEDDTIGSQPFNI